MKKIHFLFLLFFIAHSVIVYAVTIEDADEQLQRYHFSRAIDMYQTILGEKEDEYEILCRLAHSFTIWAAFSHKTIDKRYLCQQAILYAHKAIAANGNGYQGYVLLARASGQFSEIVPPKKRVTMIPVIKEACDNVIALAPDNAEVYMILGSWHFNITQAKWYEKKAAVLLFGGLPDASLEKAEQYFLRSVALDHDNIEAYYKLALTQFAMGKEQNAINALHKVLQCTAISVRYKKFQTKAEEFLQKHTKRRVL